MGVARRLVTGSLVGPRQAEHVLARRRPGSGSSRSAPPGRAASRGTSARCRSPRRSRSRRASARRRSRPPTTHRRPAASPCSPRAARLAASNSSAALEAHQVGRLDVDVRPRDRKLHALVLADRPVEDDALPGVLRRALDEPAAVANAFGRDQDPLGVQAVEQIPEPLAFFADQRRRPAPPDRRRTAPSSRDSSSCGSAGSSGRGRPPRAYRPAGSTARRCASSPARSASCGRPAAAGRSAPAREIHTFWPLTT